MVSNQSKSNLKTHANCMQKKRGYDFLIRNLLIFSVGAPGFEPGTPCSQSRCATGLRYAPKIVCGCERVSVCVLGGGAGIRTRGTVSSTSV